MFGQGSLPASSCSNVGMDRDGWMNDLIGVMPPAGVALESVSILIGRFVTVTHSDTGLLL